MRLCDTLEAQQQQRQTTRMHLNNAALDALLAAENGDLPRRWQFVQDHFDLLYADPQNVARLRQAILQLAVQGKLVSQGPSDEPASVLLERIKEEKQRLYKAGQDPQAEEAAARRGRGEAVHTLPQGWEWARLGVLAEAAAPASTGRSTRVNQDHGESTHTCAPLTSGTAAFALEGSAAHCRVA